jgi:hypothetical protein
MFRIVENCFDASETMVRESTLPLIFGTRTEAVTFIWHYLQETFVSGKFGYHLADDYWWGCDQESEPRLRRYRILSG